MKNVRCNSARRSCGAREKIQLGKNNLWAAERFCGHGVVGLLMILMRDESPNPARKRVRPTMQPALAERRSNNDHDGDRFVKQLASVVEQNREAYKEAMVQFRATQSSYPLQHRSDSK